VSRYLLPSGAIQELDIANPVIFAVGGFAVREDLTLTADPQVVEILEAIGLHLGFAVRQCSGCKLVLGLSACHEGGVTHGMCPACLQKFYPEYVNRAPRG